MECLNSGYLDQLTCGRWVWWKGRTLTQGKAVRAGRATSTTWEFQGLKIERASVNAHLSWSPELCPLHDDVDDTRRSFRTSLIERTSVRISLGPENEFCQQDQSDQTYKN
jgi:hypothetical protein